MTDVEGLKSGKITSEAIVDALAYEREECLRIIRALAMTFEKKRDVRSRASAGALRLAANAIETRGGNAG